jgi:hypothetical protein
MHFDQFVPGGPTLCHLEAVAGKNLTTGWPPHDGPIRAPMAGRSFASGPG